ncbi:type II 3-dehydroquinate dehydratase [Spirochaetota bacterium]
MKKVLVLNGPNLNLLGKREPTVYGNASLGDISLRLESVAPSLGVELEFFQSNHEGALIDELHACIDLVDGAIFNPGAYSHTSIALRDAIAAVGYPVIELHISNIFARETFRQHSLLAGVCKGSISGFGLLSYELALIAIAELVKKD